VTALVLLLALVSTSSSTTFASSTTTPTTSSTTTSTSQPPPPLANAYCVSDALLAWAHDHPRQAMTRDDWIAIYTACGK